MKIKLGLSTGIKVGQLGIPRSSATGSSDATRPTVTITCTQTSPTGASTLNFTITFSESVTGFEVADFVVTNGTKGALGGSGAVYTCDVTPSASGAVTANVAAGVAADGAGNTNTAATEVSITYQPLLLNLVAFYKMEESGANNRVNSASSSFPMVPIGTIGQAAGKVGNCATMGSSGTNYLATAADAALTTLTWSNGITYAFWYYVPTTLVANTEPFLKYETGGADFYITLTNGTQVQIYFNDSVSGDTRVQKAFTTSVDTWYFAAVRYNPSTKKAELRTNADAWSIASSGLSNEPKNLRQRIYLTAGGKNLYMDALGLWNRYLSDAEVTALYNSGNGLEYPF